MNLIPILAAAQKTEVTDTLPHLVGMLLVLVTLACLWGVCALSATVIRMLAPAPAAPQPVTVKTAPPVAAPDGLTPEIIAVISAAIASVTDSSHRIVAIKRQGSTWEKAGRQSVLSSHKIR